MDAQAHLLSLGWAGPGHPLHPSSYKQKGHRGLAYDPNSAKTAFSRNTYPSNGLIKPLLVSQKQGKLGVGRRAHEPQAGNQWWLKGFEKALGDVGKSESERSSGTSTPVRFPVDCGKLGALYSFFVRGEQIEGTLEEGIARSKRGGKKRKSDALDGEDDEKDKREFEEVAAFIAVRDKDEKRRQPKDKELVDVQFMAVEAFMEARDGKQQETRKSVDAEVPADVSMEASENLKKKARSEHKRSKTDLPTESKEERRERQRRRREKKALQGAVPPAVNVSHSSHHDEALKALRKAEKKRRKAEMTTQEALS